MFKLQLSPEAIQDLQGIKEDITTELVNPDAAIQTVTKIFNAMRGLTRFPGSGAPLSSVADVQTEYRFLVCGNYLIFYRHEGDDVYIIRVLYGRRDYLKILFGEPQTTDSI